MSPPCLLLLLPSLLLLSAGESAPAFTVELTGTAARMMNKARKAHQSSEFLNAHNTARGVHGMPPLRWDVGLTRFASQWARKRKVDCKMVHSGGPYGENMFWSRAMAWSPSKIVAQWVGERSNYNPTSNSCSPGSMCGHYTQVVWRTTTSVGCASIKCYNETGYLAVCEYNPPGNYEGERPFDATVVTDT
ncbi:PREDICTED: pathogenesis-related protein PRB1-2 [Tarenaya hassleriana]|uniref:pathogenesis-related protein PRB1-2 n=1 Tax=Tarenaya hassleriana TaxID=28532 RepID=UPI00053C30EC|nr:PREDICTED: pathogenesis-related protein PRB1-2 [Tarenaya hassleriana]